MALVATPGAANANAYGTVAEGDAYFETRLQSSAWTGATTPTKEAGLISATRIADALRVFNPSDEEWQSFWTGVAATEAQALAWPRTGMRNRNGYAIASNVIPQELKNVIFELALLLIGADRLAPSQVSELGLVGLKAGPVDLKFKDKIEAPDALPAQLIALLVPSWIYVPPSTSRAYFEVL